VPRDACEGRCKGWHGGVCSGNVEVAVMGVGGSDGDITVDIVL